MRLGLQRTVSLLFCCYTRRRPQQTILDPTTAFLQSGIDALKVSRSTPVIIADYGSSHGRNTIHLMKTIMDHLRAANKLRQAPLLIHNDLPTNDWNWLFQFMAQDRSYPGLASGRSFYEQCLPSRCLSFGFSAASLHYLSRRPCNIRDHCYIDFAQDTERQLFEKQSRSDWRLFVEHRSEELRSGGILVLSIPCRNHVNELGFEFYFDLIYQCARDSSLLSPLELIDFTLPFYLRSFSECVDEDLFDRCELKLIQSELICSRSVIFDHYRQGRITREESATALTMLLRPGTESALEEALRIHGRTVTEIERITKQFWSLVERSIQDQLHPDVVRTYATYLILRKK